MLCTRPKTNKFVNLNFEYDFLTTCANEAGRHKVPVGSVHERTDESLFHERSLVVLHPQGDAPLCVLNSFLSSLELYGDLNAVSKLKLLSTKMLQLTGSFDEYFVLNKRAPRPASCPHLDRPCYLLWNLLLLAGGTPNTKRDTRMDVLFHAVRTDKAVKWQATDVGAYGNHALEPGPGCRVIRKLTQLIDSCNVILLVQLLGADGSSSHSACIVRRAKVPCDACRTSARLRLHLYSLTTPHIILRIYPVSYAAAGTVYHRQQRAFCACSNGGILKTHRCKQMHRLGESYKV